MNSESLPAANNGAAVPETGNATAPDSPPARQSAGQFPFPIPPLMLEGDDIETGPLPADAPKFFEPAAAPVLEEEGELPDAYGTEKLLLTARDPNWLCAHWDLTREQQRRHCDRADDGQLTLRVHREDLAGQPVAEIKVHPEARHWFVHVERAGIRYHAELGCQTTGGGWFPISTSSATLTPPNQMSPNLGVKFATIPSALPLAQLLALAGGAAAPNLSLTEALELLRHQGHPDLPAAPPATTWTADQARSLAAVSLPAHDWPPTLSSSLDLTEINQPAFRELPTSPGGNSSPSSPFGGFPPAKHFWLNLNAELVVYGATEPDAIVTIGGRPIPLRPDGSFTYRFALPDGQYELPVVAISAVRTDGRAAELKFSRATEHHGEVGTHPQDPGLKPPSPENLPGAS